MGFRFRKSIKVGPTRINLSKKGVGVRVGVGPRVVRTTVSVPGTGLFWQSGKRKMTSNVMEAKYWLGRSYLKLGDKKRAKTELTKVYAEDVNYRDIQELIAELGLD